MTNQPAPARHRRLLRLQEVVERVGMRRSWIYREIAAGRFPPPVKLGRASRWDTASVEGFLAQCAGVSSAVSGADEPC